MVIIYENTQLFNNLLNYCTPSFKNFGLYFAMNGCANISLISMRYSAFLRKARRMKSLASSVRSTYSGKVTSSETMRLRSNYEYILKGILPMRHS